MSDVIGPRNISAQPPQSMMQMMMGGSESGKDGDLIRNKADKEVDRILKEQYERGMQLLTENREILDEIAQTLIEKEKIDGEALLRVIQEKNPELIDQSQIEAVAALSSPSSEK